MVLEPVGKLYFMEKTYYSEGYISDPPKKTIICILSRKTSKTIKEADFADNFLCF